MATMKKYEEYIGAEVDCYLGGDLESEDLTAMSDDEYYNLCTDIKNEIVSDDAFSLYIENHIKKLARQYLDSKGIHYHKEEI